MNKNPFRFGLATRVLTVMLLAALFLGGFLLHNEYRSSYQELLDFGLFASRIAAHECEYALYVQESDTLLESLNKILVEPSIIYAAIHDKSGKLLAQKSKLKENFKPSFTKDLKSSTDSHRPSIHKTKTGIEFTDLIVPIKSQANPNLAADLSENPPQSQLLGYLQLGLSHRTYERKLHSMFLYMGICTVFYLLLAGLLAFDLSRQVVKPVRELAEATKKVAAGDFDMPVSASGSGEVAELTLAFGTMQEHLAISRKKVEERTIALANEKERLRVILQSIGDAVIATDEQGNVQFINPAAETLLAKDSETAFGTNIENLFIVEPEGKEAAATTISGSIQIPREGVIKGEDAKYVSTTAAPLQSVEGETIGSILAIRDETERRRVLQQAQRQDRLASLGRFAAGIVHEIKNPLQSVRSAAELFGISAPNEDLRELSELVLEDVDRLSALLHDILAYARPQDVAFRTECDVHKALEGVVGLTRPVLASKNVVLETAVPSDLPEVVVVHQRLKQILINLINNAGEAMDDGGRITVQAYKSVINEADFVTIEIIDTGCGMDKETLSHIFEPFYSTRNKGTGLGLFLVESFVTEMGGEISVTSEIDQGTTFKVSLPAKVEEATHA
mgnify:CR=1 FL=1